jgi:hypothetical protein
MGWVMSDQIGLSWVIFECMIEIMSHPTIWQWLFSIIVFKKSRLFNRSPRSSLDGLRVKCLLFFYLCPFLLYIYFTFVSSSFCLIVLWGVLFFHDQGATSVNHANIFVNFQYQMASRVLLMRCPEFNTCTR